MRFFYTAQETADLLGMTLSGVYMAIRRGQIQGAAKVNGEWKIPAEQVRQERIGRALMGKLPEAA